MHPQGYWRKMQQITINWPFWFFSAVIELVRELLISYMHSSIEQDINTIITGRYRATFFLLFELQRDIEQVRMCATRSLINLSDMSDHSGERIELWKISIVLSSRWRRYHLSPITYECSPVDAWMNTAHQAGYSTNGLVIKTCHLSLLLSVRRINCSINWHADIVQYIIKNTLEIF